MSPRSRFGCIDVADWGIDTMSCASFTVDFWYAYGMLRLCIGENSGGVPKSRKTRLLEPNPIPHRSHSMSAFIKCNYFVLLRPVFFGLHKLQTADNFGKACAPGFERFTFLFEILILVVDGAGYVCLLVVQYSCNHMAGNLHLA